MSGKTWHLGSNKFSPYRDRARKIAPIALAARTCLALPAPTFQLALNLSPLTFRRFSHRSVLLSWTGFGQTLGR